MNNSSLSITTPVILCFRSCSIFSCLKKIFSRTPGQKLQHLRRPINHFPPIPSLPHSESRAQETEYLELTILYACCLAVGKNSPFNHHRRPNYDKFPQRGFLVGLSLFPTLLHLEYSDLQAAFTHINSSENIRQSVANFSKS